MICPKCSTELPDNAQFCSACGKKIPAPKSGSFGAVQKEYPSAAKLYTMIMLGVYGVALLTCFICNLAIEGGLSWFFIVLFSVAIAFSITNLPVLLKNHKLIFSALAAMVFLYALLLACNIYTRGDWFGQAFLIASLPLACVWAILITVKIKGINFFFKNAIIMAVCGIITVATNDWVACVLEGEIHLFFHRFSSQFELMGENGSINGLIGLCFFAVAVIMAVSGVVAVIVKKRMKK